MHQASAAVRLAPRSAGFAGAQGQPLDRRYQGSGHLHHPQVLRRSGSLRRLLGEGAGNQPPSCSLKVPSAARLSQGPSSPLRCAEGWPLHPRVQPLRVLLSVRGPRRCCRAEGNPAGRAAARRGERREGRGGERSKLETWEKRVEPWAGEQDQLLTGVRSWPGCRLVLLPCPSHHLPPGLANACPWGLHVGSLCWGQRWLSVRRAPPGEVSSLGASLKETLGSSRTELSQPNGELQPPSGGAAPSPGATHLGERQGPRGRGVGGSGQGGVAAGGCWTVPGQGEQRHPRNCPDVSCPELPQRVHCWHRPLQGW